MDFQVCRPQNYRVLCHLKQFQGYNKPELSKHLQRSEQKQVVSFWLFVTYPVKDSASWATSVLNCFHDARRYLCSPNLFISHHDLLKDINYDCRNSTCVHEPFWDAIWTCVSFTSLHELLRDVSTAFWALPFRPIELSTFLAWDQSINHRITPSGERYKQ